MNIINTCIQRKIVLHSTKEGYTFENNLNSKILGFAFGLVAEIERNLISIRTREALAVRKAEGKKLVRPYGSCPQLNVLIQNKEKIIELMDNSVPYKKIAKKYKVSILSLIHIFSHLHALTRNEPARAIVTDKFNTFTPVSYTHLDVYKRQILSV